jgi:hypothetical protein
VAYFALCFAYEVMNKVATILFWADCGMVHFLS